MYKVARVEDKQAQRGAALAAKLDAKKREREKERERKTRGQRTRRRE